MNFIHKIRFMLEPHISKKTQQTKQQKMQVICFYTQIWADTHKYTNATIAQT